MADHGNKCYVPGRAGMGWCLYSERHGKQITRSNKITRATKGTCLAPLLAVACYSTYDFTYHINIVRRDDGEWFTDPEQHWQASDLVKCVVSTVAP